MQGLSEIHTPRVKNTNRNTLSRSRAYSVRRSRTKCHSAFKQSFCI